MTSDQLSLYVSRIHNDAYAEYAATESSVGKPLVSPKLKVAIISAGIEINLQKQQCSAADKHVDECKDMRVEEHTDAQPDDHPGATALINRDRVATIRAPVTFPANVLLTETEANRFKGTVNAGELADTADVIRDELSSIGVEAQEAIESVAEELLGAEQEEQAQCVVEWLELLLAASDATVDSVVRAGHELLNQLELTLCETAPIETALRQLEACVAGMYNSGAAAMALRALACVSFRKYCSCV